MAGFISINRTITPEAEKYIYRRPTTKAWVILLGIFGFLMLWAHSSWISVVVLLIILFVSIPFLRKYERGKNEKYYKLLKTGILTRSSLQFVSSKNATAKPKKVNMRYFYNLRFYDLHDKPHVTRFAFLNELNIDQYSDIPIIFSAANPKEAVIFHKEFKTSKNNMKGFIKEPRLSVSGNIVNLG